MAEVNPPIFVPVNAQYGADELGLPYRDVFGEGVGGAGDLQVTDGPAGLQIVVAAGFAWIKGDQDPAAQPTYRVRNDAPVTLTCTTADGSNPRKDRVIAEVRDTSFGGAANDWRLRIVAGTPAAIPVAPAEPATAITLAIVDVPAGAATLSPANITDLRPRARIGTGNLQVPLAGLAPAGSEGQFIKLVGGQWTPAALGLPLPVVTSIPPGVGDEFFIRVDSPRRIWQFKWEGGANNWAFVGGAPLLAHVGTSEATASSGYVDLASVGPTLTVPFTGDYIIEFGVRIALTSGVGVGRGRMSVSVNGNPAIDDDGVDLTAGSTSQFPAGNVSRSYQISLVAGHTVRLKYRCDNGATASFAHRWLKLTPVVLASV